MLIHSFTYNFSRMQYRVRKTKEKRKERRVKSERKLDVLRILIP